MYYIKELNIYFVRQSLTKRVNSNICIYLKQGTTLELYIVGDKLKFSTYLV
jgi:hypothetical protein